MTHSWQLVCVLFSHWITSYKSTLHWRGMREFLIYTTHLLIPRWLTQPWQEHVNDSIHQKKYNRLSGGVRMIHWLKRELLVQRWLIAPLRLHFSAAAAGSTVVSLLEFGLSDYSTGSNSSFSKTCQVNFKTPFHIKREFCDYVMGCIHLAEDVFRSE